MFAVSILLLATVFVGFARSYFLRPWFPDWPAPTERFFYSVHGTLFTTWFVLLVAQVWLVSRGRFAAHRRLGWVGACVAAVMLPVGIHAVLLSARRDVLRTDLPFSPLPFLTVPVFDLLVFAVLVAAAITLRRRPAWHKRLMLVASISVLTAAVARVPGIIAASPADIWRFLAATDLFLMPLVAWDLRSLRGVHPATLIAGGVLVVSQPLRLWLGHTDAWMALATALTRS